MGKYCSLLLCSLRLYFEERDTCWCLYSQLFRMTVMSNNKSCDLSLILVDFFSKWVNRQTKNKLATVPDNLGRFSTNTINWRSYTSSADNITKVLIHIYLYLVPLFPPFFLRLAAFLRCLPLPRKYLHCPYAP